MNKKTIVHLIHSLDSGGCENMMLRTLPQVTDFDHLVVVLKRQGELADQFIKKKIPVVQSSPLHIISELKNINPSLVITYLFHADVVGRLIVQPLTRHQVVPFLRTTYNHPQYWLHRTFETLTTFLVKNYLANSESVKKQYSEQFGADHHKIMVVPNGIDVDYYDSLAKNRNLPRSLGIGSGGLILTCVANLHAYKGHTYLLEAFEQVFQNQQNITLLLVGDGPEKNHLLNQINRYTSKSNILFLGRRNDIPQILKITDIFVMPTFLEGMSNAILEAMASGLPIITTNIDENKRWLEESASALLVDPGSSSQIARAIKTLLDDPALAKRLAAQAKTVVRERYSIASTSQTFTKTIYRLLDDQ